MWLITLLLGAVIIWLIHFWINSKHRYWKNHRIPYLSSTSPFKVIFTYWFTKKGMLDIFIDEYNKYEGERFVGHFHIFSPAIMIRDIDLVHRVCIKDFSYFTDRVLPSESNDIFTESLGSLTGDRWRTLRHKMTPTYTGSKIKMMFDPIKESCDEVVAVLNKKIGEDIEARDFMFRFAINAIANISFGLKVDAFNENSEQDNEFVTISKLFFKPSILVMLKLIIMMTMPKVKNILKFNITDKRIDTFYKNLVNGMIAHREKTGEIRNDFLQIMLDQKKKEQEEAKLEKKSTTSVEDQVEEPEDHELLNQLKNIQHENDNYKSKNVFTDECIISQTFVFISAGSDNIAAATSFILYELAVNPQLQEKVQNEIDSVISENGFNYQTMARLPYMEQFIEESMRLHTNAPFITRVCTQNYKIPDTDVVLEKGTVIHLPVVGIMRDPKYFPDPETFNPDRFKNIEDIHPGLSLSFGIGPRMCIAKRLVMLQLKMIITTLLQNFTVKLSPKTIMPMKIQRSSVIQHVEGGLWVQFERR